MKAFRLGLALVATLACAPVQAAIYTENFDTDFAQWKTRWFGQNTNATNFVSDLAYRGNNVTGLSVDDGNFFDGGAIRVTFNDDIAGLLTGLSFDLLAFNQQTLVVFDKDGNELTSYQVPVTGGPVNPPFFTEADYAQSAYSPFSITSTNGIGGFSFLPFGAAGNFSIDNIVVSAVPEPTTWAMMIGGFGMIGGAMRRRRLSIGALAG